MLPDASTYEVVLTWREAGDRRELRGEVLGRTSGVDAAQHLVDVTFADALTRDLVTEDARLAVFAIDRGNAPFQVEAAWRVCG